GNLHISALSSVQIGEVRGQQGFPAGRGLWLCSQAGVGLLTLGWEKGPNMSKLKVLYGELDEQVLAEQAASLEKAGHKVQTAVGRKGVLEALKGGGLDLVVLG